jgi:hypothetical protein
MKLYVNNVELLHPSIEKENIWKAQNGSTKRTLVVIANGLANQFSLREDEVTANLVNGNHIRCSFGYLEKGNHSFIYLNKPSPNEYHKVFGLFLNNEYGYSLYKGKTFFEGSSVGSRTEESKFGLYSVGTVLEVFGHNHTSSKFYELRKDNGWVEISQEDVDTINSSDEINKSHFVETK